MIYTFSDGIQDQFGGTEQRKFQLRNLLSLLAEMSQQPTSQQLTTLDHALLAWRGDTPQVDDITLVGIRVNKE